MKILLINKHLYPSGGDFTYLNSLGKLLKEKNHEILFWGMSDPRNEIVENNNFFVDSINYDELNKKKSIRNSIKVITKSIYSREASFKLKEMLSKFNPDIVHMNNIHSHLTPSIINAIRSFSIPIVWTLHDYELICPSIHFLSNGKVCEKCKIKKYYQCTINKCKKDSLRASFVTTIKSYFHSFLNIENNIDRFIAPSKFIKSKFNEFGWSENKIIFIRNFLSDIPHELPEKNSNADFILYFGGLADWKGLDTLIESAIINRNIDIIIAGTGPYEQTIKSYINDNKLFNVKLVGLLNKVELNNYISKSRFIIVPSKWYENCPYSIMETMSMGTAVVGANIGGIPEMVIDGHTGLLFEPGNVKDLSEKISYLYNNKMLAKKMGINSFNYAKKYLNKNKYYEQLIDVYDKLL